MSKTLFQIGQFHGESPLGLYATWPTPDSKLNFWDASLKAGNDSYRIISSVKKQVFDSLSGLYINFQTQAVSNAAYFDLQWPTSNTIGKFRRIGFTLVGTGKIKVLFSEEFSSEASLPNAGTLLVSGGQPLGYINVICTNALGYFKTATSTSSIIENKKIFLFAAGGGGGAGTGDANSFTENLKHRLVNSYYNYVTPLVFSSIEQTMTASATAIFDVVDGVYRYDSAGAEFKSIGLFDTEFNTGDHDSRQLELHVEWFDVSTLDSNAVYSASLDNNTFEVVSMTRQGVSNKFTGSKLLAIPAQTTLFTQASTNQNTELNATTLKSIAKKVSLTQKMAVNGITINLNKVGSPNGSYIVTLIKDNSNSPTGDVVYSKIALNSTLSVGANTIALSGFRNVLPIGDYWIKIEMDDTYRSSFVTGTTVISVQTQSGGTDFVYNASSWVAGTVNMKYILLGHAYDLRVKVVSSASGKKLSAIGVYYDEDVGSVASNPQALQKFSFSGDLNQNIFPVTMFLPDPSRLKIYDIRTGQVYRFGAFDISGHTITFPSGTFLSSGNIIELLFDQSEGSGFDNSDSNANLLASNHLGSTDSTVDKSLSGRGIYLRRPDGTLREICIDDSDNIVIYSV